MCILAYESVIRILQLINTFKMNELIIWYLQ